LDLRGRTWQDAGEDYIMRVGRYGVDASGSGWEPVAESCALDKVPLGSIKGREFLD